jgi:hypothetical protein
MLLARRAAALTRPRVIARGLAGVTGEAAASVADEFNAEMALLFGGAEGDVHAAARAHTDFFTQHGRLAAQRGAGAAERPAPAATGEGDEEAARLTVADDASAASGAAWQPNAAMQSAAHASSTPAVRGIVVHHHHHYYGGSGRGGTPSTAPPMSGCVVEVHHHHHYHGSGSGSGDATGGAKLA